MSQEIKNNEIVEDATQLLDELLLTKLRELQSTKQAVQNELAEIGLLKYQIKKRNQYVETVLEQVHTDEKTLLTEIKEKHGEININLETGEISQIENV